MLHGPIVAGDTLETIEDGGLGCGEAGGVDIVVCGEGGLEEDGDDGAGNEGAGGG